MWERLGGAREKQRRVNYFFFYSPPAAALLRQRRVCILCVYSLVYIVQCCAGACNGRESMYVNPGGAECHVRRVGYAFPASYTTTKLQTAYIILVTPLLCVESNTRVLWLQ